MCKENKTRCKNISNEEQAKKTKESIDQRSKRWKTKETEKSQLNHGLAKSISRGGFPYSFR